MLHNEQQQNGVSLLHAQLETTLYQKICVAPQNKCDHRASKRVAHLGTALQVGYLPGDGRAAICADDREGEGLGEAADVLANLDHQFARGRHDQRYWPVTLHQRRLQQQHKSPF